jgi:hypothetical protein
MEDYKALTEYAMTARQQEVMGALAEYGSMRKAAAALDTTQQNVGNILKSVRVNASRRLYAPDHGLTHPVQEGFTGDYTIQRNGDGETERTWIKGKADKDQKEKLYNEFIDGLAFQVKALKPQKLAKKRQATNELASAMIFGDAHLGMIARAIQTLGEEHDLNTAIRDILLAVDYCVECAPASKEGWFINVGDWSHSDNSHKQTFKGTPLDAVDHFAIMRAAGMLQRYAVDSMLKKFEIVKVVNARGNHDHDTAFALNMFLEACYEKEPRVQIQNNESKFNFIEFGQCLIGINHGDQINANRLAGVMTKLQSEAWGRTSFRRWWMGHIHHKQMFEHDTGVTLESFHTLAPVDYWHSASAYGSERRVTLLTLHREFGEVNRMSPSLELIRSQQRVL